MCSASVVVGARATCRRPSLEARAQTNARSANERPTAWLRSSLSNASCVRKWRVQLTYNTQSALAAGKNWCCKMLIGSNRPKLFSRLFSVAPFEELISSALSLVRPIIDVAPKQQQESAYIPRKVRRDDNDDGGGSTSIALANDHTSFFVSHFQLTLGDEMGARALGAPAYTPLSEIPLCRGGQSQICRFLSCAAQNFQHDDKISNLNLAAQTLGDRKLRKAISA